MPRVSVRPASSPRPRLSYRPSWPRSCPAHPLHAASLPLLVCATALAAAPAAAQQAEPPSRPAGDSARATPVPMAAGDSLRRLRPATPTDSGRALTAPTPAGGGGRATAPTPAGGGGRVPADTALPMPSRDSVASMAPLSPPADSAAQVRALGPLGDSAHATPPGAFPSAPPDSAAAMPAGAQPGDGAGRAGGAPGAAASMSPGPDSTRALARADSACASRRAAVPLRCVGSALRGDSAGVRGLFLAAGRRLLAHAQRADREGRAPRTRGEYFRAAFGPAALLRAGATAGVEQLLGRPRWLPRTGAGYGFRFGLRLGMGALSEGIRYETVRWLRVRTAAFEPCDCRGTGARLAHALAAPFRAETPTGSRFSPLTPLTELSSGMVFAAAAGGVHPRQGLEAGLTGMLSMSVMAVLREFRPWEKWLGR